MLCFIIFVLIKKMKLKRKMLTEYSNTNEYKKQNGNGLHNI